MCGEIEGCVVFLYVGVRARVCVAAGGRAGRRTSGATLPLPPKHTQDGEHGAQARGNDAVRGAYRPRSFARYSIRYDGGAPGPADGSSTSRCDSSFSPCSARPSAPGQRPPGCCDSVRRARPPPRRCRIDRRRSPRAPGICSDRQHRRGRSSCTFAPFFFLLALRFWPKPPESSLSESSSSKSSPSLLSSRQRVALLLWRSGGLLFIHEQVVGARLLLLPLLWRLDLLYDGLFGIVDGFAAIAPALCLCYRARRASSMSMRARSAAVASRPRSALCPGPWWGPCP